MSWSEFKLRLFSYNRQQEDELLKLRRLAWVTLIAPYQDPKKLRGKKEETWWKIGKTKTDTASEELRERGRRAMEDYIKIKMQQDGGVKC